VYVKKEWIDKANLAKLAKENIAMLLALVAYDLIYVSVKLC
jgi:hypothetical protein